MPFTNFTNPYQNPANIPEDYRKHTNLSKLFKADATYVRPVEDPVTIWAIALLHQEYGVPLDALELELNANFSEGTHQGWEKTRRSLDNLINACTNMAPRINVWVKVVQGASMFNVGAFRV